MKNESNDEVLGHFVRWDKETHTLRKGKHPDASANRWFVDPIGSMAPFFRTNMIELRPCRAEDFEGVVTLLRQLWPDKPLDPASLRKVYERALASDRQLYLCAVSGQHVLGFGSLAIKGNLWNEAFVGYVDEMVIDAAHRGRGVGTQILDHLTFWARERGCNRIELDSGFHRKEAHAFYESRGFQRRAYLYSKLI